MMTMQQIWPRLDKKLQDKFHGNYGTPAFREAVVIVFLLATHKSIKVRLTPAEIEELDALWYGSLLPTHPLHKVRAWVQETVADWGEKVDDYTGKHIQHKFEWIDRQVPVLIDHINRRFAPPTR